MPGNRCRYKKQPVTVKIDHAERETTEWREKQKGSRGIRRGQRYRLVFQFPIRIMPPITLHPSKGSDVLTRRRS
ncbi:hypothetical protein BWI84_28540 (plasmid) [Escherichia coli]|nr:hypothetical protein BWI84_28540 [Escherichia coli]